VSRGSRSFRRRSRKRLLPKGQKEMLSADTVMGWKVGKAVRDVPRRSLG
jgi:hypothetical protein